MKGNTRTFAEDKFIGCCSDSNVKAFAEASANGTYPLTTTDSYGGIFTKGAYPFAAGRYYFGTLVPINSVASYSYEWQITVTNAAVPEPTTLALAGLGIAGIGFIRRRSKKAA